jgi:hypothetical protein
MPSVRASRVMVPDQRPSSGRRSRRRLLTGGAALAATALAGCSGSAGSDDADCTTTAVEHGAGDIIQQASAMPADGAVELFVSLTDPGDELPAASVLLEDSSGDLRGEIPTTDAREYRQHLGPAPRHGRVVLRAVDDDREELDSLTVDFHCPGE